MAARSTGNLRVVVMDSSAETAGQGVLDIINRTARGDAELKCLMPFLKLVTGDGGPGTFVIDCETFFRPRSVEDSPDSTQFVGTMCLQASVCELSWKPVLSAIATS